MIGLIKGDTRSLDCGSNRHLTQERSRAPEEQLGL